MTISRLESLSLNNFRSIDGRITVPLDAQVVLIYGANGAGKTSLLSGLELALTGSIDAMERADPKYRDYLVHRGAPEADVSVVAQDSDGVQQANWELSFRKNMWGGSQALNADDARYFSERCYLAQATLGRLLEIYESREPGHDSALARFVNDVLGLDALENLIDGLKQSRDIRNTRRLVPEIAELERDLATMQEEVTDRRIECDRLNAELDVLGQNLNTQILALDVENPVPPPANQSFPQDLLTHVLSGPQISSEQAALIELTNFSREIQAMEKRVSVAKKSSADQELPALEAEASARTDAATQWLATAGTAIDQTLDEARRLFADLPSVSETNPVTALVSGLERIGLNLRRAEDSLSADESARTRRDELAQASERDRSRIALIEEQIATETEGAAEVARLLTELVPHLHGNECIVCGREYSEVSPEPLAAEVSRRASRLSEQADRLASLNQAKASALADLNRALAEINSLQSKVMESSARSELVATRAQLQHWAERLEAFQGEAGVGSQVIAAGANARRALADAIGVSATWSEIRQSAGELAQKLGFETPVETEPLEDVLRQLREHVRFRTLAADDRAAIRSRLGEMQKDWIQTSQRLETERARHQRAQDRRLQLERRQADVEARRHLAREIHRTASAVQVSVIQTVFNENLNSVWRDLFVRLAPNEPFVPAFHVPDDPRRSLSPLLITNHRGGGRGGSPGAMLSAGNLNTAALTLFLALHLAAGEHLPFLILDDPVQSMDDLHISQFAALLRTLSKQHKRQVVIAIHERALFDYLTLELSPAYEGDRLITVELKKPANGSTSAEPIYYEWLEDPVSVSA
jgi:DNA repair protein SbcC/Rad50